MPATIAPSGANRASITVTRIPAGQNFCPPESVAQSGGSKRFGDHGHGAHAAPHRAFRVQINQLQAGETLAVIVHQGVFRHVRVDVAHRPPVKEAAWRGAIERAFGSARGRPGRRLSDQLAQFLLGTGLHGRQAGS